MGLSASFEHIICLTNLGFLEKVECIDFVQLTVLILSSVSSAKEQCVHMTHHFEEERGSVSMEGCLSIDGLSIFLGVLR